MSVDSVVSGVIATILVFILSQIYNKILLPKYQELIYSGIDVDDEWISNPDHELPENSNSIRGQNVKLELKQCANKITGTAISIRITEESPIEKYRTFKIEGTIKDRFVILTLMYNNRKRIGINNMLLEVIGEGRKMKGYCAYYDIIDNTINSMPIEFVRAADMQSADSAKK